MAFSDWMGVDSTNLSAVRFDPETGEMEIEFRNGSVYAWSGVTEDQVTSMINAPSPGKHFNANIRGLFGVGRRVNG